MTDSWIVKYYKNCIFASTTKTFHIISSKTWMLGLTEYLILFLLPKQPANPPSRAIAKILETVRSFVLDLLKGFSCLPEIWFSSQILTALKSPSLSSKLSWEAQLQEQATLLCSLLSFVLSFFVKLRCGAARQGELVNFEFSGFYTWRSLVLFSFHFVCLLQ